MDPNSNEFWQKFFDDLLPNANSIVSVEKTWGDNLTISTHLVFEWEWLTLEMREILSHLGCFYPEHVHSMGMRYISFDFYLPHPHFDSEKWWTKNEFMCLALSDFLTSEEV